MSRVIAALGIFLVACASAPAPRATTVEAVGTSAPLPSSAPAGPAPSERAVELTLRRADGTFLEVGELRGNVVLLVLFATFDGVSQMLLNPLRDVAERHPDVVMVGVAVQPNARVLVDAYAHALSPPFETTYDPSDTIGTGRSPLGVVDAVPVLIALDPSGAVVGGHVGFARAPQIEALLDRASGG